MRCSCSASTGCDTISTVLDEEVFESPLAEDPVTVRLRQLAIAASIVLIAAQVVVCIDLLDNGELMRLAHWHWERSQRRRTERRRWNLEVQRVQYEAWLTLQEADA